MEDDDTEGGVAKDFKGWSTHILRYSLLCICFNPEAMRGIPVPHSTQIIGGAKHRSGYELVFKKILCLICLTSCIWRGGPFMEDDDTEGGVAKDFL